MSDTLIFTDLETAGLTPGVHPVIQIGAIKEVDGEVIDEMNVLLRPHAGAKISPKALEVNGISMKDLRENPDRVEPGVAVFDFLKFCGLSNRFTPAKDRVHFVGYNSVRFDFPHMEALAEAGGIDYFYAKFHFPGIDVAVLAADRLRGERHLLPDFKLMTVAKHMGVDTEGQAHDALFDVRVTRDLYHKLRGDHVSGS